MPNTFAYIILLSWPVVTFLLLKRYGTGPGALIALLAAYMFLPASFSIELPGLPDPDKFLMTTVTILFFIMLRGEKLGLTYLGKHFKFLLLVFIIAPFLTAITNSERYFNLPGLSLYDGLSNSVIGFLEFIPFLIGLTYFREEKQQFRLFKYFAIATFIYAFFTLFEIRMSPQLHSWVYGYFPHDWTQQIRGGGFRAVVFMGHGLLVAMFLAIGVVFWASLSRAKYKVFRYSSALGLVIVFITLLLSKSLAALLYALFALVIIKYFKPKQIYLASAILVLIFLTYPISSTTGLFPHGGLVNLASDINEDRADSLEYRFRNENMLLAHANEKPWFGWGAWGRNRIYDIETGEDISVTDGRWIITLGSSGWVGFLSTYLFLLLPILIVFRRSKSMNFTSQQDKILLSGHCLIVALLVIDQLPNSSFNPLYWIIAGSLLGRSQVLLARKPLTILMKTSH
jgi:hypothetical protein